MPEAHAPGPDTEVILKLDRVSCGYGASAILRDVTLELRAGEIHTLLGRNGMGKTTLVRTIMGYLPPLAGSMSYFGQDITPANPARLVRSGIAYAPQEKAIFQDLSIGENLKLATRSDRDYRAMLPNVFALFPFFEERLKQPAGTLSGGEQKMLLVSRALMTRPKLVLLDEVSEGLQPSVVDQLGAIIRNARRASGTAFLLIEQNIKLAWSVADRWSVLKGGALAAEGLVDAASLPIASSHLAI